MPKTKPPQTDAKTGVALEGKFPANHRLRAEALVEAGKTEDPDGVIGADLIADTKARLAKAKAATQKTAADKASADTKG